MSPPMPSHSKSTAQNFSSRWGKSECVEGKGRSRLIVLEFPDYATALACYHSPEYEKARNVWRIGKSEADLN